MAIPFVTAASRETEERSSTASRASMMETSQSYWKSNPYLSKEFTGEDDSLHPQWVVIALDKKEDINAIRIDWAEPYAQAYEVQYWVGDGDAMDDQDKGTWKPFASGNVTDGKGRTATLRLDSSPVTTKYVRVLMTRSSNTCDTHGSSDRRNCVGYAIREALSRNHR